MCDSLGPLHWLSTLNALRQDAVAVARRLIAFSGSCTAPTVSSSAKVDNDFLDEDRRETKRVKIDNTWREVTSLNTSRHRRRTTVRGLRAATSTKIDKSMAPINMIELIGWLQWIRVQGKQTQRPGTAAPAELLMLISIQGMHKFKLKNVANAEKSTGRVENSRKWTSVVYQYSRENWMNSKTEILILKNFCLDN